MKKTDPSLDPLLERLRGTALARARAHPQGHLLEGRAESLHLRFDLPLVGGLDATRDQLVREIEGAVRDTLDRIAASRPGRVPCRACRSSECEHSLPPDPRSIFVGYRANGNPRYEDLGQWLLDGGDPRVGQLFEDPPGIVALAFSEQELHRELVSPSRSAIRLRGQVVAGWYRTAVPGAGPEKFAVGFQLLTLGRHTQLHPVGMGPGGETLEELQSRLGGTPWDEAAAWAAAAARTLGAPRKGRARRAAQERRIEGLLASLARRLEKQHRGRSRRTRHAQDRHGGGERPTRMAMADLSRATDDQLLFDERHETVVVLGDRGRTHFFTTEGRLVSSVRYSPEAIGRRRKRGFWRPATEDQISLLRSAES